MLSVRGLSVWNGRAAVLRGVELDVRPGEAAVLVAPNGAGKTTLLRAVGGGPRPRAGGRAEGSCVADGVAKGADPAAYRRKVLYVAEGGALLDRRLTVYEHLAAARGLWGSGCSLLGIVRRCGIDGFVGLAVGRLSQGMRQRVSLAVALATGAPYLLLDEPANGLDQSNVDLFWDLVGERVRDGAGVLLSTHILAGIEGRYDRLLYLRDGKVGQYDPGGTRRDCRDVYGELFPK